MAAAEEKPDKALEAMLYTQVEGKNRGIPEAVFIENVEAICQVRKPQEVVAKLQELYSKYQYMQSSLAAQRSSMKTKLPDITSARETVGHMVKAKEEAGDGAIFTYQLSENIYTRAKVPPTDSVCLWLGANCMLEYTLEEATELLEKNEANAKATLASIEEDRAFLRDQITTTEVNIARCHNYGVKLRQKQQAEAAELQAAAAPERSALPAPSGQPQASAPPPAAASKYKYTWLQQKEEVEVSVPVPKGAQKSDIKVVILADSLRVEHAGTVLLEGQLAGMCSPNGSTWTMTGSRVEVTLEKAEEAPWPKLFREEA